MGTRALGLAGALTAVVGLGAACEPAEPPMEITLNVSRDIVLLPDESEFQTGSTVLFRGEVSCTRPEPIDLWITLRQNQVVNGQQVTVEARGGEHSITCEGPEEQEWARAYTFGERFQPGSTGIEWTACTNPGSTIDEDCIFVRRPYSEIRTK